MAMPISLPWYTVDDLERFEVRARIVVTIDLASIFESLEPLT